MRKKKSFVFRTRPAWYNGPVGKKISLSIIVQILLPVGGFYGAASHHALVACCAKKLSPPFIDLFRPSSKFARSHPLLVIGLNYNDNSGSPPNNSHRRRGVALHYGGKKIDVFV